MVARVSIIRTGKICDIFPTGFPVLRLISLTWLAFVGTGIPTSGVERDVCTDTKDGDGAFRATLFNDQTPKHACAELRRTQQCCKVAG